MIRVVKISYVDIYGTCRLLHRGKYNLDEPHDAQKYLNVLRKCERKFRFTVLPHSDSSMLIEFEKEKTPLPLGLF